MRLEFESNVSALLFAESESAEKAIESESAQVREMLREGIKSAQAGKRPEARHLLLRVTEAEPQNESAWLWLASISEYPEELFIFLNNVLEINPVNERALEWLRATKSLLAKTFVQRGIDAARDGQTDLAKQCFYQAAAHDEQNEMAWLWLASVSDLAEEKIVHLNKVLSINPENEAARAALKTVHGETAGALLQKANLAAFAGDSPAANEMLDEILLKTPDFENAWILKSHLANGFDEIIRCFEKILEINPQNEAASVGLNSLRVFMRDAAPSTENENPENSVNLENSVVEEDLAIEENLAADLTVEEYVLLETEEEIFVAESTSFEEVASDGNAVEELELSHDDVKVVDLAADEIVLAEDSAPRGDENIASFEQNVSAEEESELPAVFEAVVEEDSVETEVLEDHRLPNSDFSTAAKDDFEVEEQTAAIANDDANENYNLSETDNLGEDINLNENDNSNETVDAFVEPVQAAAEPRSSFADFDDLAPAENNFNGADTDYGFEAVREILQKAEALKKRTMEQSGNQAEDLYYEEFSYGDSVRERKQADGGEELAAPKSFSASENTEVAEDKVSVEAKDADENGYSNGFENADAAFFEEHSIDPAVSVQDNSDQTRIEVHTCPFCRAENEPQAFACGNCRAVLSLSDLELLLANQEADRQMIQQTITRMETEKNLRDFSERELTFLGVGHINLKNLRQGFAYLQKASQMNPNNILLTAQVNGLAIRLDEIERKEEIYESQPKGRTILVVDDSPTVRKLISSKLEKIGHEVFCAVDGMDALAKLNEIVPDLILLDITMPRMDGYQVCKLIRNNPAIRDIPVVMISGKDGFFDKVRGRMAGTTGYITKPFGPETLMKALDIYIKNDESVTA